MQAKFNIIARGTGLGWVGEGVETWSRDPAEWTAFTTVSEARRELEWAWAPRFPAVRVTEVYRGLGIVEAA